MSDAISNETPCRGCGAPIRFVKMRTGGNMPVESTPHKMVVTFVESGVLTDCYEPHWGNCDKAEDFKT